MLPKLPGNLASVLAGLAALGLVAPAFVEEQAENERRLQELVVLTGKSAEEILAAFRQTSLSFLEFSQIASERARAGFDPLDWKESIEIG